MERRISDGHTNNRILQRVIGQVRCRWTASDETPPACANIGFSVIVIEPSGSSYTFVLFCRVYYPPDPKAHYVALDARRNRN